MRKEIIQEIEVPEGVKIHIANQEIVIKGKEGENKRKLDSRGFIIKQEGNKIIISNAKSTKKEKKQINTLAAHVRNMIKGVINKYVYDLKVCFNHFPVTVEVKGDVAFIKNFLGEKVPRQVKIPKGAEIKVNKEKITVTSSDLEIAGQAASRLEIGTKIRNRDRRVFQDGIFITKKPGVED